MTNSQIIFITGKTEYALKAFDYDATDFLHKPITPERFKTAVSKALDYHKLKSEATPEDYIFVKSNLKKFKIAVNDIFWIEALGDYVKIVTNNEPVIVLSTMKAFSEKLTAYSFLRTHKSYIVNLNKISGFDSKTLKINNESLPLSRTKKAMLAEALDNL